MYVYVYMFVNNHNNDVYIQICTVRMKTFCGDKMIKLPLLAAIQMTEILPVEGRKREPPAPSTPLPLVLQAVSHRRPTRKTTPQLSSSRSYSIGSRYNTPIIKLNTLFNIIIKMPFIYSIATSSCSTSNIICHIAN